MRERMLSLQAYFVERAVSFLLPSSRSRLSDGVLNVSIAGDQGKEGIGIAVRDSKSLFSSSSSLLVPVIQCFTDLSSHCQTGESKKKFQ